MIRRAGRRGLPAPMFAAWRAAVAAAGETDEPVLAWAPAAPTADEPEAGPVVGTRGRLWLPSRQSAGAAVGWRGVGWHRIEHGSWNAELGRLAWKLDDGVRGQVDLTAPGRLPELFRERIAASVAVEETIRVGPGRSLTVSGRRDLSRPGDRLLWLTTLPRGTDRSQPGVAEQADATLARLRAEYDR